MRPTSDSTDDGPRARVSVFDKHVSGSVTHPATVLRGSTERSKLCDDIERVHVCVMKITVWSDQHVGTKAARGDRVDVTAESRGLTVTHARGQRPRGVGAAPPKR